MARTRTFRGYRAATTLITAMAAVGAALWQAMSIPDPSHNPSAFVHLWVAVAVGSIVVVAIEIVRRYWRSSLERELTVLAVEHFLPCIIIGGLLTIVLCQCARSALWMLPGLWAIFFGLGILASRRLLPGPIALIAAFYLLMGLGYITLGPEGLRLSARMMGLTFGIGQTALAAVLYWSLERHHES